MKKFVDTVKKITGTITQSPEERAGYGQMGKDFRDEDSRITPSQTSSYTQLGGDLPEKMENVSSKVEELLQQAEKTKENLLYKKAMSSYKQTVSDLFEQLREESHLTKEIQAVHSKATEAVKKGLLEDASSLLEQSQVNLSTKDAESLTKQLKKLSKMEVMSPVEVAITLKSAIVDMETKVNGHIGARAKQNIATESTDTVSNALNTVATVSKNIGDASKVATLGTLASPAAPLAPAVALSGTIVSTIGSAPKQIHDTKKAIDDGVFAITMANTAQGVLDKVERALPEAVHNKLQTKIDKVVARSSVDESTRQPLLVSGNLYEGASMTQSLGMKVGIQALKATEGFDPIGVTAVGGLIESAVSRKLESNAAARRENEVTNIPSKEDVAYIDVPKLSDTLKTGAQQIEEYCARSLAGTLDERRDLEFRNEVVGKDKILTEEERQEVRQLQATSKQVSRETSSVQHTGATEKGANLAPSATITEKSTEKGRQVGS